MTRLAAVMLGLLSASVFAAGYQIDVQSARGTAMAGAQAVFVDDASSAYYNPAGLTQGGQGFGVLIGDSLIMPQIQYAPLSGSSTSTQFSVSPPPHAYIRVGILDELAIGIGFFTPFGASVQWPDAWQGRYPSTQSSLQTFDIDFNVAYKPHPRLSIAAGIDVVRGTVYIARDLNFIDSQGSTQLGGGAWGVSYNAGVQFEAIEGILYAGAVLRGGVGLNFKGNAHFDNVPPEFAEQLVDQPITSSVTLPLNATFGIGVKPMSSLRFEVDVGYVNWASFHDLTITFPNTPSLTIPQVKSWYDTASVHIGGEYDVSQSFKVRLGVAYDPTPSPAATLTPDLPDATRIAIAAGVGWKHSSGFKVDFGFQFIVLLSQPSSAPGFAGNYGGTAEVVSLSLGWDTARHVAPKVEEPPAAGPPQDGATPVPAPPAP